MNGRPRQSSQSFAKLKTIGCVIYGPEKIAEMSKSCIVDTSVGDSSMESKSEFRDAATKASDISHSEETHTSYAGDWNCRSCRTFREGHLAKDVVQMLTGTATVGPTTRSSCFKCGAFKDEFSSSSRGGVKFGDWICSRPGCNFASRMECFRCNAPR